jgi:hypothetical protein
MLYNLDLQAQGNQVVNAGGNHKMSTAESRTRCLSCYMQSFESQAYIRDLAVHCDGQASEASVTTSSNMHINCPHPRHTLTS